MKIATLQFGPKIGDVEGNIRRADEILTKREDDLRGLDLLVLPEMAFSGYNFPSSEAIAPFMEPSQAGPSTEWAQTISKRLNCIVCVGYPESFKASQQSQTQSEDVDSSSERHYNSVIITDRSGSVLFNYRKRFLYYTDETWASEGNIQWGGIDLPIETQAQSSSPSILTSMGVCMDINPYQFKTPYTDYEFASHVLQSGSRLVVLPMSWLTHMSKSDLEGSSIVPDMDTLNYWIQRFWPLISGKGKFGYKGEEDREIVLVFANRTGEELGDESKGHSTARYAGSSTIITIRRRGSPSSGEEDVSGTDILLWDMLGRGEEGLCLADTSKKPESVFKVRRRSSAGGESSDED